MALVQGLIGVLVAVIIGVAVAIPVTQQVITDANLTGTTATIVSLIPLFIGLTILIATVGVMGFSG
jgi:hypothetical protein